MKWGIAADASKGEMLSHTRPAFLREFQLFRTVQAGVDAPRNQPSPYEKPSSSEDDYYGTLDRIIRSEIEGRTVSFAKLSQLCGGAWPGLVADRLTKMGLWTSVESESISVPTPSHVPELHCGFGEWYFSADSASDLAREFISKQTFSLLLGSPTIAQLALKRGADFALVDSNPFVNLRFPELRNRLHYSSVEQLNVPFPRPSTIFFDAPWYMPRILFWLAKASQLANRRSTIAMPLFQSMTRPAAEMERAAILRVAESIGKTELVRDCIAYDSPLYESEALASRNICAHPNWRRADLLIIRNPSPITLPQLDHVGFQEIWENFLIATQVVRLRLHPMPRKRKSLISPIQGANGYVFDTVSARDARRKQIDLWTSRNRVAVVGDVRKIRYLLSILENSTQDTSKILRSLLSVSDADALSELLAFTTFH